MVRPPFRLSLSAPFASAHLFAALGYVLVAVAFTWPLVVHLGDSFLGPPGGDLGAYVWNLWAFRHEIVAHHRFPWSTLEVLSLSPPTVLTLQNYATFGDVLALPLIAPLGIVRTYNLLAMGACVLTAQAMFAYARVRTNDSAAAWLGGLAFGFSPYMLVRQTAHFSLTLAAPLPVFALLMYRMVYQPTRWTAVFSGVTVAWAYLCDPYYAVYCLLILLFVIGYVTLDVELKRDVPIRGTTFLDVALCSLLGLVAVILATGGWRFMLFGRLVNVTDLYTPMLLLTALATVRICLRYRFQLRVSAPQLRAAAALAVYAGVAMAVVLTPVLYAMTLPSGSPFGVPAPVPWRSSAPGLDVMAYLTSNPLHVWSPGWVSDWLTAEPNGFVENVAAFSWVQLGVVAIAIYLRGWRWSRGWLIFTAVFVLLSLGPFVRIAGISTLIPTPWALLRYVPIVSLARMPPRLAILASMGGAMLLAMSLQRLRTTARWGWLSLPLAGMLLLGELMPAARTLSSAQIPDIYGSVVADTRDVRLLTLPFGLRDGLMSRGDYSSLAQYHQTLHEKPLVGGYLSRLPKGAVGRYERLPVMKALLDLSEGHPIDAGRAEAAIATARERRAALKIGWIVVDHERVSPELLAFAREAFEMQPVARDGSWELFRAALP